MEKHPLDVDKIFGRRVPKYKKPAKPRKIDLPKSVETGTGNYKGGLIANVEKDRADGHMICALLPNGRKKLLTKYKPGTVYSLCFHKGELYGGLVRDVVEIFSQESVGERKHRVLALCSYKGELFDAGPYGIFKTLGGKKIKDCEYDSPIFALCFHKGELIESKGSTHVSKAMEHYNISLTLLGINALCSHDGNLFCGGGTPFSGHIVERRGSNHITRDGRVHALVSHDGRLFDSGKHGKVFDTLNDSRGENPLWDFGDLSVFDLVSVDKKFWKKVIKMPGEIT